MASNDTNTDSLRQIICSRICCCCCPNIESRDQTSQGYAILTNEQQEQEQERQKQQKQQPEPEPEPQASCYKMASNNTVGNQIIGPVTVHGDMHMTANNPGAEPQNSASEPLTTQRKEFVDTLKKRHISTYSKTYLPWNKSNPLITEDIYIPIEPTESESRAQRTSKQSFLQEIEGNECKRMVVTGDGGSGKSMMSKQLSTNWASGKSLKNYEVTIRIDVKNIKGNREKDIYDAILKASDYNAMTVAQLQKYLEQIQDQLLIVLDGLDEAPNHSRDAGDFRIIEIISGVGNPRQAAICSYFTPYNI
jgi:hypothetical protein